MGNSRRQPPPDDRRDTGEACRSAVSDEGVNFPTGGRAGAGRAHFHLDRRGGFLTAARRRS